MTDAALHPPLVTALRESASRLPPASIDRIWFFPPRTQGKLESAIAVLALFEPASAEDRREVVTLVVTGAPGDASREIELTDQGSVPADRVERLIEGVLRRLRDEREIPRIEEIGGDLDRWTAVLGPAPGVG